jgi:GNAT superfamily N-acetyltransferase
LVVERIRRAKRRDRAAVARCVADAFAQDPAWAFLLGDEYHRLAPLFAGALFDLRIGSATVWVADAVTAVAMWEHCGGDAPSPAEAQPVWPAYRAAAGAAAWDRLRAYDRAVDQARPSGRYWYLGVLATAPRHQRQGLATAVMAPVLEEADGQGIDCCLETSTMANRRFYERRGFTEVTPVHIPSGPPTWWLRRSPL